MRALTVALCGCSAAEDMTRALGASHEALFTALLGAELLSHVHDPPREARHSPDSACGAACPCVLQTGLYLPVTLTLDYPPEGCVPQSALLGAKLAGHAALVFDGVTVSDLEAADLTVDGAPIEAHLGGAVVGAIGSPTVSVAGALAGASVELSIDLGDPIGVDGWVGLDDADVTLAGVVLPWEWLGAPCPRPLSGEAWVNVEHGGPPNVVRYADPGDGVVTVERRRRESEPVQYCDFVPPK